MKPDERLLADLLGATDKPDAIAIIEHGDHGIPVKRCYSLLDKWADRDYWDYGVSLRTGWWTPKGVAWLHEIGVRT